MTEAQEIIHLKSQLLLARHALQNALEALQRANAIVPHTANFFRDINRASAAVARIGE